MNAFRTIIIAAAGAASLSTAVIAHDGATGIVMHRMEAMKEISENMKALAAMVKGEKPFDADTVHGSAVIMANHAKHMPHMFPEGSLDKPTEALPVIWARWDDFTGIAKKMEADAMALAEAGKTASSAQDIVPALAEVGKSCKACHQDFRLAK